MALLDESCVQSQLWIDLANPVSYHCGPVRQNSIGPREVSTCWISFSSSSVSYPAPRSITLRSRNPNHYRPRTLLPAGKHITQSGQNRNCERISGRSAYVNFRKLQSIPRVTSSDKGNASTSLNALLVPDCWHCSVRARPALDLCECLCLGAEKRSCC